MVFLHPGAPRLAPLCTTCRDRAGYAFISWGDEAYVVIGNLAVASMKLAAKSLSEARAGAAPAKSYGVREASRVRGGFALISLGGILTGISLALLLPGPDDSSSEPLELSAVLNSEIDGAVQSMRSDVVAAAATDAKSCKTPLAFVSVVGTPAAPASVVRIRSGAYVSPPIALGAVAQRVAIPFPAPYETGKGVLEIEGNAENVGVWLKPMWQAAKLDGTRPIHVTWVPRKNCN